MCLYLGRNDSRIVKTAKADIKVYKLLDVWSNKSPFQNFLYTPKTMYRLRKALHVTLDHRNCSIVEKGYHAFSNLKDALEYNKYLPNGRKVVEFTIPKGAKYFEGFWDNNDPCIVATSIRSGDLKEIPQPDLRILVDTII